MHGNKYLDGRKKSNYSSYRCHGRENKRSCKNRKIIRDYIDSFVLDELNAYSLKSRSWYYDSFIFT